MSKKTLIMCVSVAVVLIGLIGVAVHFLYSGVGDTASQQKLKVDTAILAAIPSDAAAVMMFQDLEKGLPLLSRFCSGAFKDYVEEESVSGSLATVPVAASLHYSGSIVPLLVAVSADSTAYRRAQETGLAARFSALEDKTFLLISTSETIVSSASRHLSAGASILDNKSFAALAADVAQKNAAYFSNDYAEKLLSVYDNFFSKYSSFVKKTAEWTAVYLRGASETDYLLKTGIGKDASYYMNVLEAIRPGTAKMWEICPTNTIFAVSLSPAEQEAFHDAYVKYLDANQKLSQYKQNADILRQRAAGETPESWAGDIDEAASISWKLDDGTVYKVNAVRKAETSGTEFELIDGYHYSGFAGCEFGGLFSLSQDSENCYVRIGSWTVSGTRAALSDLVSAVKQEETLSQTIPAKDCAAAIYYTSNDTKMLTYGKQGLELNVTKAVVQSNRTPELVVEMPEGPFEVTNSQTGKKNTFYQNEQLSLCLKDHTGKGLWGVPFKQRICGYVSDIDYYNNGKIQFLFGAGSSLYLISRLGAFVSGFPVDLGKEILLGPAVYDFTGSKGYTVMVLHKDNTLEMYNLHGKKPENWQGITTEDVIVSLPELLTVSGQRYWKVRTTRETLFFGFNGGEQIKDRKILNTLK